MKINKFAAHWRGILLFSLAGAGLSAVSAVPAAATEFEKTNLISDGSVPAVKVDSHLVNPWGIAAAPGGSFWVSDNGTGLATVYSVMGSSVNISPIVVTIPAASGSGTSAPTGQVYNGSAGFDLSNGRPASFLFDSEDGAISGWNGGGTAEIVKATKNAVYKALAIDGGDLYAANFHSGKIELYNSSFGLVRTFTDPTLPTGYAPFDVKVLNGKVYVTFALQDAAKHDDVAGAHNGFVDVYNLDGSHRKRLVSGGHLNSPWGLTIAPSSFGSFAGDLLVGNFGDGTIDAYDATTGAFDGALLATNGKKIHITDLWDLTIGNGGAGGDADTLYFTAGLADESHGLFGSLGAVPGTLSAVSNGSPSAIPEPSTWAMLALGFGGLAMAARRRRAPIALA